MMTKKAYHNPVLVQESVDGLHIDPSGTYVDVTFGGGGHSRAILDRLGPRGKLMAFDQDKDALSNTIDDGRFVLINENFRFIKRFLRLHGIRQVNGILGDLGVSSHQFDEASRGFSTRFDGPLDMRMDQNHSVSAYTILNTYSEKQLTNILRTYGELRSAPKMARLIVNNRTPEIKTTQQLKDCIRPLLPAHREHKVMAQVYQAVRIEVNQELEALKEFLKQTETLICEGGRLSIISYHSLEDRLVKRYMRNGLFEGEPEKDMFGRTAVPFRKVHNLIVPSQEEIGSNNRARSAKLRVAEKL